MTTHEVLDAYEREVVTYVIDQPRISGIIKVLRRELPSIVEQIGTEEVRAYRNHRAVQGLSGTTINKEVGVFSAALAHARRSGATTHTIKPQNVRIVHRLQVVMPANVQRLIECATDLRCKVYIALLFVTGQRKSAVQMLRRDQIVDGVIEFERSNDMLAPRRKRRARTPITAEIQTLLDKLVEVYGVTDYILPDCKDGFGYCVYKLDRWMRDASEKAGIPCSAHVIRHSAATAAIGNGASLFEVSSMLGHSNTRITEDIYIKRQPEQIRSTVTKLGSMVQVA